MKKITPWPVFSDRYQLSTSLRVQGKGDIDFDEVSRILKRHPSRTIKKGTSSRIGKIYEIDTWVLASESAENDSLDFHLRWFMKKCLGIESLEALRSLRGVEDVDIFCAVTVPSTTCRIDLPADLLLLLRDMALDLEISLDFGARENEVVHNDGQTEELSSPISAEVNEQASAVLRGSFVPSLQLAAFEALVFSQSGDVESPILISTSLRSSVDFALEIPGTEGSLLDHSLQELNKLLRDSVQQIYAFGERDSFYIQGRFETTCAWASTRLSHRSFDLPILLQCPMMIEVALV